MLLKGRLAAALRKLNLRDGQPWLDDARIARAIRDLEQAAGHRLMEVNQSATELLLKGTVVDGLPDWDHGRPQPVQFIDFENPDEQRLPGHQPVQGRTDQRARACHPGRGAVRQRHPAGRGGVQEPRHREPLAGGHQPAPALLEPAPGALSDAYTENEGVERLFHTNQLLIASDFFEARAATIGAPPEAYLEWADTSPVPLSTVAEELGVLPRCAETGGGGARTGDARAGADRTRRHAAVLPQAGAATRSAARPGRHLHSQQILVAGMLRPAHLLDLIRNFTVFQQVDGKTRKVVARYQQFRAVHKAVARLQDRPTRARARTATSAAASSGTPRAPARA